MAQDTLQADRVKIDCDPLTVTMCPIAFFPRPALTVALIKHTWPCPRANAMVNFLAAVWLSDKDQRNKTLDVMSLSLRITLYIISPDLVLSLMPDAFKQIKPAASYGIKSSANEF